MNWPEELKSNIKDFFGRATDEQLEHALEKANYRVFSEIDTPILDFHRRLIPKLSSPWAEWQVENYQLVSAGSHYTLVPYLTTGLTLSSHFT